MNLLYAVTIVTRLLIAVQLVASVGCQTQSRITHRYGRLGKTDREGELELTLTQAAGTGELILHLENRSDHSVRDFFPASIFEGMIWVIQEGASPKRVYPEGYFRLLMTSTWSNPETDLPPHSTIEFRIPIETLVSPFSDRQPKADTPAFAYAQLTGIELLSNVVSLKSSERIRWGYGLDTLGNLVAATNEPVSVHRMEPASR